MSDPSRQDVTIPPESAGKRLDVVLTELFPGYSRSRLQEWVRAERITVNGQFPQNRQRVIGGEAVCLLLPATEDETLSGDYAPEPIPLDVVFEDDHIIVINKPANLVMHPAVGNRSGTVLNALLYHYPEVSAVPRAGIVHRLDKDTTGLFVVARTLLAHNSLIGQLQTRTMGRQYSAVVQGTMVSGGTVDAPIGRHPQDRKRMAIRDSGKPAITHFRVTEKFSTHTHLSVSLETGRTHQIRVHMTSIQHPLVGDGTYGGRRRFPKGLSEAARNLVHDFPRQALHAQKIGLNHPSSNTSLSWETDLPDDMQDLLLALRQVND